MISSKFLKIEDPLGIISNLGLFHEHLGSLPVKNEHLPFTDEQQRHSDRNERHSRI